MRSVQSCWLVLMMIAGGVPIAASTYERSWIDGVLDERLHGVWASRGYGWVVELDPPNVIRSYDYSQTGCFVEEVPPEDFSEFIRLFSREGDVVRVTGQPENTTIYTLDRIESVPAVCASQPPNTREGVFTHFADVMATHYALFDVHGVDWDARRSAAQPKIVADMSDKALFDVFGGMLDGLNDGHLRLVAEIDGEREMVRPGRAKVGPILDVAFDAQRRWKDKGTFQQKWVARQHKRVRKLLGRSHQKGANDQLTWGRVGNVGYLSIAGMGGFAGEGDDASGDVSMAEELRAVHSAMAAALTDLADTDAIVVDITLNGGGYDRVSLAIASHFADAKTLAFTKVAGDAEGATPQPFHTLASTDPYRKPVALLTSNYTVSAAEIFTMAMRALPNVTHYGEPTRGALSDVLEKELANGWILTLSNEIYRDAEGILWEGRGIPPSEPITVFATDGIETSHIEAIQTTMERAERRLGE